jgi:hypothetical protein
MAKAEAHAAKTPGEPFRHRRDEGRAKMAKAAASPNDAPRGRGRRAKGSGQGGAADSAGTQTAAGTTGAGGSPTAAGTTGGSAE